MKKQIVADAVIYLICMIAAVLLNVAVSAMTVRFGISLGNLNYFGRSWVRLVTGLAVGSGVLGAVVYRECYKSMQFQIGTLLPSLSLAGLAHLGIACLLKFYPFIAGGVRDLAGILSFGTEFASESKIAEIRFGTYLVAFLLYFAFETAVVLLCGIIGKKRRIKNREGLHLTDETEEHAEEP